MPSNFPKPYCKPANTKPPANPKTAPPIIVAVAPVAPKPAPIPAAIVALDAAAVLIPIPSDVAPALIRDAPAIKPADETTPVAPIAALAAKLPAIAAPDPNGFLDCPAPVGAVGIPMPCILLKLAVASAKLRCI